MRSGSFSATGNGVPPRNDPGGHVHPLLPENVLEIDANPICSSEFYGGVRSRLELELSSLQNTENEANFPLPLDIQKS